MLQKELPAPLLLPVLLWCMGIFAGKLLSAPFWAWTALCGALIPAYLLGKGYRAYLLLFLCFALGGMRYQGVQHTSLLDAVLSSKGHIQQDAVFQVSEQLSRSGGLYEIKLEKLAGIATKQKLLLSSQKILEPGTTYSALLEILPGKRDAELDNFPARPIAYIRQGLTEIATGRKLIPLAAWRASLLADLDAKLGDKADFAKALLFSDRPSKGGYREELTRSGMIHLIVVSGLHIWFIYGMCMVLLNALLPNRIAEAVFLVAIVFYAALNFWSPSVLRSILMIGLFIIARWRSIPLSGGQMLAVSLLLITVIAPEQLFDIGLQLSYLCIGVIMLGIPKLVWVAETKLPNDWLRFKINNLLGLLLLNVVVSIGVLPLTLYYFGTGSLNGIVGNLLGIPLSAALLLLGFLVLFLPAGNAVIDAYATSYRFLLDVFERWTEWVAQLPFYLQNMWLSPLQLLGCAVLILTALYLLKNLKFRKQALPFALLGVALIALPAVLNTSESGIYVFASGTSDCLLLRLDDGQDVLVDTGQMAYNASKSWAERKLLPWMGKKGIRDLDWLVLSHLDSDHSGGFPALSNAMPVRNIIVSDETLSDTRWKAWRDKGLLKSSHIWCVRDTISFFIGDARLKFLHPDSSYVAWDTNTGSLVFRLDKDGQRYLFTGDADKEAEQQLLERYPQELDCDYLKAGHHGSRSSSSEEFVRMVSPKEVWITASGSNRWGFPHPEPLKAFQRYAQRVRSTADGTFYIPFAQKD